MTGEFPLLTYPDELRSRILETDDLVFRDGTRITGEKIWDFMTGEGPRRFPYAFSTNPAYGHQFSQDLSYVSGFYRNYLNLTGMDRLKAFVRKGIPLVVEPGGISSDIYYASGCIPVVPHFLRGWVMYDHEGQHFKHANVFGASLFEEARQKISVECCNLIAPLLLLQTKNIPIAAIAPSLCSRCSDMAFATEAFRAQSPDIPTLMMDYPSNHNTGAWRVSYLKEEIRSLTEQLCAISGREADDNNLRAEIHLENEARRLSRECQQIWQQAKVPPTNSIDNNFTYLGLRGSFDFTMANQVLEMTCDEIRNRVRNGIAGVGVAEDPVRIFTCGSCVRPNPDFVDRKGGVLVGRDDGWSTITMDVKETGDPYENLAEAYADLPYERSTEERAEWTIEQVKESRADGVLFMYNWGCNYQSGVAEMIIDLIKERTGLPAISIEVETTGQMESSEQLHNRVEAFIEMVR